MDRFTNKALWVLYVLGVVFFIHGCGEDRAGNSTPPSQNVKGVVERDSDGDGLTDEDEINIYGTNPSRADTDGDGLTDSQEIRIYNTNAVNPDTDGDCLLDSFEILNYETNATNKDTDGDSVDDGIEIYSYGFDYNRTCIGSPETLTNGFNSDPAKDNIPNDGTDVINALDSNNHKDSDGDGLSDSAEIYYGTNPLLDDTDLDGLKDGEEVNVYDTNATNPDTDGDCLLDSFEILNYETNSTNKDSDGDGIEDGIEIYSYGVDVNKTCLSVPEMIATGFNPAPAISNVFINGSEDAVINALDPNTNKDSDGDGLSDSDENFYGTNPLSDDSDSDGLKDGEEILVYDTNATNSDTDGDGLKDGEEVHTYDTNATNPDTDGDCLLDSFEILNYETNATNSDTDGDNVKDGIEIYSYGVDVNKTCLSSPETIESGFNPSPAISNPPQGNISMINALNPNNHKDSDGDGLSDLDEIIYGTNPLSDDTDGDGLKDGEEIHTYETNATNSDTDNDGLTDGEEVHTYDSNATSPDTDKDGLTDGEEVYTYETNLTNSDTDKDGLTDGEEILTYDTNATNPDMDNDGLTDGEEINTYETNPKTSDTDKDGLTDGEEVTHYHTDPTNEDSDGDGLKDGEELTNFAELTDPLKQDSDNDGLIDSIEVRRDDLNATNPDTDGDCLLDSYELNFYHTETNNTDTDRDGVEDGLEIYGDLNTPCISTPETLIEGVNENPAQDNFTKPDVIDALDPLNDSDGDRQANIKELECAEGNPKDVLKLCLYATNSTRGISLVSTGFVYIPGGFDVDGDGINETGFWTSSYHARGKKDEIIEPEFVNEAVGKFNTYIQKHFFMINATDNISETIHGYSDEFLSETLDTVPASKALEFSTNINPAEKKRLSGLVPVIATVALSKYDVKDSENNSLNLSLGLPSLKQYAQIQQLLEADKKNGGNGSTIRNSLLGIDKNVPLIDYITVVHEFGEGYKEFLSSIMQMKEGYIVLCTGCPWVKPWMGITKDRLIKNPNETQQDGSLVAKGTDSKLDVGMGVGPTKDDYGVLVRAGELLDLTIGVTGGISDASGTHDGIGFRAASQYLK